MELIFHAVHRGVERHRDLQPSIRSDFRRRTSTERNVFVVESCWRLWREVACLHNTVVNTRLSVGTFAIGLRCVHANGDRINYVGATIKCAQPTLLFAACVRDIT